MSDQEQNASPPKEEEKKDPKAKKGKGKSKKKLEAERKAEEERQRLLKEEEERKKAEEERLREEAEARERELAEKIVEVPDDEEQTEEEKNKERPEDKLYDYNGKRIKVNLLKSDVTDDIKDKAFEMGFEALNKYTAEKEMADYIKNTFDELFEPDWQIVIGKDFSAAFSFEIENFVFFQIEEIYFLFYKL